MTDTTRTWQVIGEDAWSHTEVLEVYKQTDPDNRESVVLVGSLVRTIMWNENDDCEAEGAAVSLCFIPAISRYDLTLRSGIEILDDGASRDGAT